MKKIISIGVLFIFFTCMFLISFVGIFFYEQGGADENGEYDEEYTVESASVFLSPMSCGYISSEYGSRWGLMHSGIDMYCADTNIYVSARGEVGEVGYDSARGYYVYIHHMIDEKKYSTAYFHLASRSKLKTGENVGTNTKVGIMGNTGDSQGAHLHFEILYHWYSETGYNQANAINPRNFLSYPDIGVYWIGRER